MPVDPTHTGGDKKEKSSCKGKSGCKSLAMSNPSKAIDNADSHEYFAENTPSQN